MYICTEIKMTHLNSGVLRVTFGIKYYLNKKNIYFCKTFTTFKSFYNKIITCQ